MSATTKPSTWLLIFDPKLRSNDGHSRNYDFAVAEAALELFDHVVIFADAAFTEPPPAGVLLRVIAQSPLMSAMRAMVLRAVPRTNSGALPNAPAGPLLVPFQRIWKGFRARGLAYSFARALREVGCNPQDRVHLFVQQADLYEIAAVDAFRGHYGRALGAHVTFHLLMRHDPEITRAGQEDLSAFRARLLRLSHAKSPRVRFHTDSEAIAADYSSLTRHEVPVNVMPIPVSQRAATCNPTKKRRPTDQVRVSMMGASRIERGFGNLPIIISNFPAFFSDSRVHFQVQINRRSADPNVAIIIQWLDSYHRQNSANGPVLDLFEGPVTEDVYFSRFCDSDILIAPYISSKYTKSTSGVFMEALHLGIPSVVMRSTWAAEIVKAAFLHGLTIGEIAEGLDVIPERTEQIWKNLPQYQAAVQIFLAKWKRDHSQGIPNLLLVGRATDKLV
jgi:hypothetical protein